MRHLQGRFHGLVFVVVFFCCPQGVIATPVNLTGGTLVDGRVVSGRVDLYHTGNVTWMSICDDGWNSKANAKVVCQMLGISGSAASATSGHAGLAYWMSNVVCSGGETDIIHCKHDDISNGSCPSLSAAGVTCSKKTCSTRW